ncbi:MAG: DUF533 domain-containing protein, partial [Acidobacteriota bacterium]
PPAHAAPPAPPHAPPPMPPLAQPHAVAQGTAPSAVPMAAPPPLPPLPQVDASPVPDPPADTTYAIVRTMVAAALADGHLDPSERDLIFRHLGESGLDAERVAQIHRDIDAPPSPFVLAGMLAPDDLDGRGVLYRFAALVVGADGTMAAAERGWLDQLAAAFGIAADAARALEDEVLAGRLNADDAS